MAFLRIMDFSPFGVLVLASTLAAHIAGSRAAAAVNVVRNKNGVRLTQDSGPRGRLEISTTDPMFSGSNSGSKTVWLPVCSEGFTDAKAEVMCQLLGYKSGRTYYTDSVANSPIPSNGFAARFINCKNSTYPNRRLYGIGSADDTADVRTGNRIHARSLSYRQYAVAIPRRASITCGFFIGLCAPQGPFAGIQCSDNPLLPAAPTSLPPPSRPPYEDYIRLVGGQFPWDSRRVESNLCPTSNQELCEDFGRLELRVPALNGDTSGDVWAPLCAVESDNENAESAAALRATIATVACQQVYGWPKLRPMPTLIVSGSLPTEEPLVFQVPQGPVDPSTAPARGSTFDPRAVSAWVTITNHPGNTPSMLQDGSLTVSTTPCKRLFALRCIPLDARRHQ